MAAEYASDAYGVYDDYYQSGFAPTEVDPGLLEYYRSLPPITEMHLDNGRIHNVPPERFDYLYDILADEAMYNRDARIVFGVVDSDGFEKGVFSSRGHDSKIGIGVRDLLDWMAGGRGPSSLLSGSDYGADVVRFIRDHSTDRYSEHGKVRDPDYIRVWVYE